MAEQEQRGDFEYENQELEAAFPRLDRALDLLRNHASDLALLDRGFPDSVENLYEVEIDEISQIDQSAPDPELEALFKRKQQTYEELMSAIESDDSRKIPGDVLAVERLRVLAREIVIECATLMDEASGTITLIERDTPEGSTDEYERRLAEVRQKIVDEFSELFGANKGLVGLLEKLFDGELDADGFREGMRIGLPAIKWRWV